MLCIKLAGRTATHQHPPPHDMKSMMFCHTLLQKLWASICGTMLLSLQPLIQSSKRKMHSNDAHILAKTPPSADRKRTVKRQATAKKNIGKYGSFGTLVCQQRGSGHTCCWCVEKGTHIQQRRSSPGGGNQSKSKGRVSGHLPQITACMHGHMMIVV